ncbi:hypothetical protein [Streptomyces smyrnaeus]|uniref:hypothetical protein n=1 Tax=Streptomyces smyrnaeus TaxID=1387713 RepID=UPI0036B711FE
MVNDCLVQCQSVGVGYFVIVFLDEEGCTMREIVRCACPFTFWGYRLRKMCDKWEVNDRFMWHGFPVVERVNASETVIVRAVGADL